MLQEVIVVEGQQDVVAIKKAVEAEVITTGGFGLSPKSLDKITLAYQKRGIIIMTDPDRAGENIRKFLAERFPNAKHAFIPREDAFKNNDIGVEQATPEAIRKALSKLQTRSLEIKEEFTMKDLIYYGLSGEPSSAVTRDKIAAELGLGYANAKQFLYRLNNYGITREEFDNALKAVLKGT